MKCCGLLIRLMLLVVIATMTWPAHAGDSPTYAEVGSDEVASPVSVWTVGSDDGEEFPYPPPLEMLEIEDLMPEPPTTLPDGFPDPGAGAGLWHDSATGETLEVPWVPPAKPTPHQGGGYQGVPWALGEEFQPETFYDMSKISNTHDAPWRMNVRLLIRFPDNSGGADHWGVCSGTMQDAEVVQTAGHCVYSHDADITSWASEIWVYPGWTGVGSEPYGVGHSTNLHSWTSWVNDGNHDYDWGLIRISRAAGMLTGWFGWAWGGDCTYHMSQTYNNASYPAEDCPLPGLHNGHDMYYWYGNVDACPNNQLQLNTGGGNCFDTAWGGMSGSGMYRIDGSSRYVHAIASTSNRTTRGYYCRVSEAWINYMNDTVIPAARGSAFDLQALDTNFEPATITAGQSTTLANFLTTNPTNGTNSGNWYLDLYLSTNSNISSSDTHLSRQSYSWSYGTMSSVRINMGQPTIPLNTPSGTYWLGVELDPATDGVPSNNDTDDWDATQVTVQGVADLRADFISAPTGVYAPYQSFPVSFHATNIGGDPSNAVTVEVRASTNQAISVMDTLLATFSYSGLSGGNIVSDARSVSFPAGMNNGDYYIGIIVDSSDDIDSSNNTAFDSTPLMRFDGLFYDGFESGSLSRWSASVP